MGNLDGSIISFQLNPNHPWFEKTDRFNVAQSIQAKKYELFNLRASEFIKRRNIKICIQNEKDSQSNAFKNYFNSKVDKAAKKIFESEIKRMFKIIEKGQFQISINILSQSFMLKRKICQIDVTNVELFTDSYGPSKRLKWND